MTLRILTANRLGDGRVVFLGEDGWTHDLAWARLAAGEAEAELLLALGRAAVAGREVVEPYLVEAVETQGGRRLAALRERIRAAGPTIRRDLGYQAGEAPKETR